MKRVLFKTGSRVEIDVVHAKIYTNFQKRVNGCTIPILAGRDSPRQHLNLGPGLTVLENVKTSVVVNALYGEIYECLCCAYSIVEKIILAVVG
jgi:hypothetical protein